jgi:hypothetical protein
MYVPKLVVVSARGSERILIQLTLIFFNLMSFPTTEFSRKGPPPPPPFKQINAVRYVETSAVRAVRDVDDVQYPCIRFVFVMLRPAHLPVKIYDGF